MLPLDKDLQSRKENIDDFGRIALRVLQYLPNVLSSYEEHNGYRIHSSLIAGVQKYIRPINQALFIYSPEDFQNKFTAFKNILEKLKDREEEWLQIEKDLIDSVVYTIQQSIGAGFDLLLSPNSARKHVGNRFEELIRVVISSMAISNSRTVLNIPYLTDKGMKNYRCENDLIISPFKNVKSTTKQLNINEIVVSVKTTSKDRMGKIFIDKILLEKFVNHPQKMVGIFLNDVQRKENSKVSFTLVSGLFMVYSTFLVELEGIYYVDPPPNALKEPYNKHMKRFSEFLTSDVWRLLAS